MSKNQEFWKKYHQDNDRKGTFMDIIKRHVETLKPKSILEIGYGIGNNLMIFEDFTNVVGVDISEYAIEIAKKVISKISILCFRCRQNSSK
jgi:ubiquinone/menaquinone biosynthesis C-methylase UbiE